MVIVGSILLAFGIDAWWDGVQEREEEQRILLGLREEFEAHRDSLEGGVQRNDSIMAGTAVFLGPPSSAAALPPAAELDRALYRIARNPTWDPSGSVRDALVTSGRLELIRSNELRRLLASWDQAVAEVQDNQVAMRTYMLDVLAPYMASHGLPLARAYATVDDWPAELPTAETSRTAFARMVGDPEFQSLLSVRYHYLVDTGQQLRGTLERARLVITLIEEQID